MNAIGTQLRNPINSRLIRWRLKVYVDAVAESGRNPVSKHQIDDRADAGRDGRTRIARPNYQAGTGIGKILFFLFS